MSGLHVDDFIDDFGGTEAERYAKWFFALYRFPAALKCAFQPWMQQYKLFATWADSPVPQRRFRVTGCSRLGDVWLSANFDRDCGYEHRVDLMQLSDWSPEP